MNEEKDNLFILTDENGNEMSFEHLDTYEYNNSTYVAMIPVDEKTEDDDEVEVVLFELGQDENGEDVLMAIQDENTLKNVYNELARRVEEDYNNGKH